MRKQQLYEARFEQEGSPHFTTIRVLASSEKEATELLTRRLAEQFPGRDGYKLVGVEKQVRS